MYRVYRVGGTQIPLTQELPLLTARQGQALVASTTCQNQDRTMTDDFHSINNE
ncbi:unnamed protein product [Fusarium venenatum]|uniref:Uncharacterized protein n=1 Tax=Fusarium venenatum TaxID=56646 RepID=A0A2L2T9A1_9HYPO|nr:uncharacterized protein FVRRES_05273 [Fusarium venenatum]CEI60837.1 unnamed protein product [Fusarium venenatum]